jgi:hypothetical protein
MSTEEEDDSIQLALSIAGFSISSLVITIFIVVTNLSIYRNKPNSFLFNPTSYKYVNYFISFYYLPYIAVYNSLKLALKYLSEGNFIVLLVFIVYIVSIISWTTIN